MPPVAVPTLNDLITAATKFGVGTLIAIFLVYKLTDAFEDKLDAQAAKLDAVAAQLTDQARRDAVHVLLLKAICQNTATTESERAVCLEAGR